MSDDVVVKKKTDFASEKVMFYPFYSGPKSFSFVLKSVLFYAIGLALLSLIFGQSILEANIAYQEQILHNPKNATPAFFALLGKSLPYFLGLWVLWAMIEAALFRRIYRGPDNSMFPWRFGKDELRVMLCQLVAYIVFIVALFMSWLVFLAIVMFFSVFSNGTILWLLELLSVVGTVIITAAVMIRFAPAASRSVAQNRIALGSVWPVAYKRFWPAFGSYAILAIVGAIIYIILAMLVSLAVYGPETLQYLKNILSGDVAKTLEHSRELAQNGGFNVRTIFTTGLTNMYFAAFSLCIAGVAVYLNILYDKGQKGSEKDNGKEMVLEQA